MMVRAIAPSNAPLVASAATPSKIPQTFGTEVGIATMAGDTAAAIARPTRMRMRAGTVGSPKPGISMNAAVMRTKTSST